MKTYNSTFKQLKLGAVFQFNAYDSTKWVKTSTRTARLIENKRVFYFGLKEPVLALHFLNDNDFLRA